MTKKPHHRVGQKEAKGREPVVFTTSLVVLVVLVFICAGMLIAPLWTPAVEVWQFRPNGQECSSLEDSAARQSCFAELNARTLRQPVKEPNETPHPFGQRGE
jgi:hypothetical protein